MAVAQYTALLWSEPAYSSHLRASLQKTSPGASRVASHPVSVNHPKPSCPIGRGMDGAAVCRGISNRTRRPGPTARPMAVPTLRLEEAFVAQLGQITLLGRIAQVGHIALATSWPYCTGGHAAQLAVLQR